MLMLSGELIEDMPVDESAIQQEEYVFIKEDEEESTKESKKEVCLCMCMHACVCVKIIPNFLFHEKYFLCIKFSLLIFEK